MDGNRFDGISKAIASRDRSSRRDAIRRAGSGAVLAGLGAAVGFGRLRAAAQAGTCTLDLEAETALGPDKGETYRGTIELPIDADGAIEGGVFRADDGKEYDLVGQATGRALSIRIALDKDRALVLTGMGTDQIARCRGAVDGTFGGPRPRDLGTWTAAAQDGGGAAITPAAGATQTGGTGGGNGTGNNGSGGGNGSSDSGTAGNGTTDNGPTPTPCPPIECGSTFVLDPATCECGCPPPYDKCGDASCCFGGAVCNPDGSCQCPAGTEPCNEVCTPSCPSGQYFDATCQCSAETSCGTGETLCNGQCVSLACPPNQLFDAGSCGCIDRCSPGQGYCNGNCIDIVNDRNNCGICGNVCLPNVPCIAGTCECPAGTDYTDGVCK